MSIFIFNCVSWTVHMYIVNINIHWKFHIIQLSGFNIKNLYPFHLIYCDNQLFVIGYGMVSLATKCIDNRRRKWRLYYQVMEHYFRKNVDRNSN